ncbi:MAG: PhnD/SsuA/transferrin family substrate-binding protein, partial [Burkholderiales bacterium]
LKREDIRILWTSDPLPSPPVVIRKDVPADMRADMLKLFTGLHKVDMALAESVAQGKTQGIMAVSHKDYGLMCQAAADEREARRRKAR